MKSINKTFFPALTGYRAIAAWIIFIYHFFPFNNPKIPDFIKNVIGEFHIGVDMFFVLSGFLITYRYIDENPINIKKYLINRIARIYPMYLLVTILVFINFYLLNRSWNIEKTKELLLSITMTKALFENYFFAGIAQGWTLTLEELFYFTAPFYLMMINKSRKFLLVLPVIIFIFGLSLKIIFSGNFGGFLQINIANYIFEFFAGIGLALIIKQKYYEKINFRFFTFWGVGIILFYLMTRNYIAQYINFKNDFARAIELGLISSLGIVPLLYGLIFEKTFIQKILSSKLMVLLGKSSYIFYLIHKGFISIYFNDYISNNKLLLFLFLNILSILMFHYLEEPFNLYIRKKYSPKSD